MEADILKKLETGQYKIIDTNALRSLLSKVRGDIAKKICSARDARYILDMSENVFYEHLKDPNCVIRPSSKKGKYVRSSVEAEAERLNKDV